MTNEVRDMKIRTREKKPQKLNDGQKQNKKKKEERNFKLCLIIRRIINNILLKKCF